MANERARKNRVPPGNEKIGSVIASSPDRVMVELIPSALPHLPQDYAGGHADVSSYLLIECGERGVFARVKAVELTAGSSFSTTGTEAAIRPVAEVEPVASVDLVSGELSVKISGAPRVGSAVYPAPGQLRGQIEALRLPPFQDARGGIEFELGSVVLNNAPVSIAPEKLFGRHCAVLGSSGGGKSWTLARIVEEAGRAKSKVLLFDASGEFHSLGGKAKHVYVGDDPAPRVGSAQVSIPFYHLTESDLFAIFRPTGPSQAPKLRAAMKSLKIALLEPQLALGGVIMKADRNKAEFERAYAEHLEEVESQYAHFDIHCLTRQIENECVNHQRSAAETNTWGGINGQDLSFCVPLINRVQDIINSPDLAPLFNPGQARSLFNEIQLFLEDPRFTVLCVSLKYLSFEHNTREIALNAVGRNILDMAREEKFRSQPLLVVLDEAHQFLSRSFKDHDVNYPLDSFGLIAKQGRKHWVTLCMATQRPRDIPEDVLSQMGTLIVHRLINDGDRSIIERASGYLDEGTSALLPGLLPGEALLLGVDFPVPLPIRVTAPAFKPDSRGPDFQTFWKTTET